MLSYNAAETYCEDARLVVCVERNTEARQCNSCCGGRVTNITQTVCVFVALSLRSHYRDITA